MRQSRFTQVSVGVVVALATCAGGGSAHAEIAAPGQPVDNSVAPGMVEHSVWSFDVSGDYKVRGSVPISYQVEEWVASDRVRNLVTDAGTGEIVAEQVQDPSGMFLFDGEANWLSQEPPQPEWLIVQSRKLEADFIRFELDHGRLKKAGTTTFAGKPALQLNSPGPVSGDSEGDEVRLFDLVDPDTLAPYRLITDVVSPLGRKLHQVRTLKSFEVVSRQRLAASTLQMGEHPGAKMGSRERRSAMTARRAPAKPKVRKAKSSVSRGHKATPRRK